MDNVSHGSTPLHPRRTTLRSLSPFGRIAALFIPHRVLPARRFAALGARASFATGF